MDMLEKVALLIAQAEGTDNQAEAEAFAQKAQSLATAYQIDVAEARARTAKKAQVEQPEQRTVRLGERGTKGLKYFVDLYSTIAHSNDVTCNIASNSTYIIPFGFPSDIDLVTMLYTALVSQMVDSANKYLATGEYKNEKVYSWQTGTHRSMDARVARASFYEGFIPAIGTRLREARREAVAATVVEQGATESSGALVLRNKELEVRDFYTKSSTARGMYRPSSSKGYSGSAHMAGKSSGNSARMGSQAAIGGSRTAIH